MDFLDGLWHLLNFCAPAAGLALVTSSIAKLLWLRELKGVSWLRLTGWAAGWTFVVAVGGLIVFGRDGKMATYAAMVLACATSVWWTGFGPGRR